MHEVLAPPRRLSGDARAYCPLCSGEVRDGLSVCGECAVALLSLDA
ncbi:MAG TPA: hypothetical protein VMK42_02670 [Anaeromyxobacteraceae bacterium]|nr:hypothetical protein [Anaeromyxobacteraceae bacterium]